MLRIDEPRVMWERRARENDRESESERKRKKMYVDALDLGLKNHVSTTIETMELFLRRRSEVACNMLGQ